MTDALTGDVNGNGLVNAGDTVTYTAVIDNTEGLGDVVDVRFLAVPDPNSTLVVGSVTTTQGTVTVGNTAGDTGIDVAVGSVLLSKAATVTFSVTVNSPIPPGVTQLSCQGNLQYQLYPPGVTDDPDTPEENDPTVTPIALGPPVFVAEKRSTLVGDTNGNGSLGAGETLEYNIVLTNQGEVAALDAVFTDSPDVNTQIQTGSVTTTQGTVTLGNGATDTSVSVDIGTIAVGGSVTIVFRVVVNDPVAPDVIQVANQGFLAGTNFASRPTDDPDTPAVDDPTIDPLNGPGGPVEPDPIPTLDSLGFLMLGAALSGLALRRLRRRRS